MLCLPRESGAGLNFGFSEAAHTVCEGEPFPASAFSPPGAGMPVLPAGQQLVTGSEEEGLGKEWAGLPQISPTSDLSSSEPRLHWLQ